MDFPGLHARGQALCIPPLPKHSASQATRWDKTHSSRNFVGTFAVDSTKSLEAVTYLTMVGM
jgi:hypothetical protein